MDKIIQKKIVAFLNCSYARVQLQDDNIIFFNQFSYKYLLDVYVDGELFHKTKFDIKNKKAVPMTIYIDTIKKTVKQNRNDIFIKMYGVKASTKTNTEEDMIQVKKILGIDKYCESEHDLYKHFIYDTFNDKIELQKLSEFEKIIYNTSYAFGPIHYLEEKNNIYSAHCYDINSEHPYIITTDNYVPMRNPIERMINDINDIDESKVGVYLVTIDFNEKTKYFKPSRKKVHAITNNFLKVLKSTNTPFKMYSNEELQYNSVEYNYSDCINLGGIFSYKIKELFKIKKTNKIAKTFLKTIVGKFSQKFEGEIKAILKEERTLYQSSHYGIPNDFRFYPFVYDLCKVNMMRYITYCYDNDINIIRIKADSIHVFKMLPEEFRDDNAFGSLKKEGYYIRAPFENVNSTFYKQFLIKPKKNNII